VSGWPEVLATATRRLRACQGGCQLAELLSFIGLGQIETSENQAARNTSQSALARTSSSVSIISRILN
jgi:hypothetical protein